MKVGVLTGGGDCPGLNAVIRAVVRKGVNIYGFDFVGYRDGWKGPLEGSTMNLGIKQCRGILPRGGTILGSSRTNPFKIEGGVERISHEESVAYFATRDRGSQIGAWASRQSRELRDRTELEAAYRDVERRFEGEEVPLPSFWGGYRVVPDRIEFWYGRAGRLHDRFAFEREGGRWSMQRLYP